MIHCFQLLFISTSSTVVQYVSFPFRRQWSDIAVSGYNAEILQFLDIVGYRLLGISQSLIPAKVGVEGIKLPN